LFNPERVRRLANPFRVECVFEFITQGCRCRSNLGLTFANAFGVFFNVNHCTETSSMALERLRDYNFRQLPSFSLGVAA